MHAYQALKHEDMTSMWWVHKPGNYGSTRMHVEKYESTQSCQAHDLADSCTYNGFIFYNILLCQSFAKSFFLGGKGGGGGLQLSWIALCVFSPHPSLAKLISPLAVFLQSF